MASPIVTLLTDFGTKDSYVGQMKGVILRHCSNATLVDLTHEVPPQSIIAGAYHLAAAWNSFPQGTVHLAVVDPGVGTGRRAVALEYLGHFFVLPDNGLISAVLRGSPLERFVEVVPRSSEHRLISKTFHGRDIFAPAAGMLAAGHALEEIGEPREPATLKRLDIPVATLSDGAVTGSVILIDRFGNALTNIERSLLVNLGPRIRVQCGSFFVTGLSETYEDVGTGDALALISSMDTLELAVREGSAFERFGITTGARVIATPLS